MNEGALIGLSGRARSGKSTVADILECVGYTQVAFADALKGAAAVMFGIDEACFYDDDRKEKIIPHWGISPRQMAQRLGTEGGRNVFGKDLWIKRLEQTLSDLHGLYTANVVVTDVRFDNEAEWVRSKGGAMINMVRPGAPSVTEHASEGGVSSHLIDAVIYNDGSFEELEAKVWRAMSGLGRLAA